MAKKQTRRSISVSRVTYERLKAFCETHNISMSQFVESRVGDFLGEGALGQPGGFLGTEIDDVASGAPGLVSAAPASTGLHVPPAVASGAGVSGALRPTMPRPASQAPSVSSAARPLSSVGSIPAATTPRVVGGSVSPGAAPSSGVSVGGAGGAPRHGAPFTSAAARFAVEPPPPIIKPKAAEPAPPPVPRTADQIFTF